MAFLWESGAQALSLSMCGLLDNMDELNQRALKIPFWYFEISMQMILKCSEIFKFQCDSELAYCLNSMTKFTRKLWNGSTRAGWDGVCASWPHQQPVVLLQPIHTCTCLSVSSCRLCIGALLPWLIQMLTAPEDSLPGGYLSGRPPLLLYAFYATATLVLQSSQGPWHFMLLSLLLVSLA